jgi:hypothetical protein
MSRSSTKGTARREVRRDLVAELMREGARCEWPGCSDQADDLHEPHTRGRGGSELDRSGIRLVCRAHHNFLHLHPQTALAAGWLVAGGPAKRIELADAHFEVLTYVKEHEDERGIAPTVPEIAAALPALTQIHQLLGDLVAKGLVEKGAARTLKAVRR